MTEELSMSKEEVKISQAEAARKLLAQKKQAQANTQTAQNLQKGGNQMMKSQNTKKINNQRKRMGV